MDADATFDDLPLTERARDAVHALGWRVPTPVQRVAVPLLASGKDVIVRAETGSGKTAAFGLVLTDTVRAPGLKALVLVPTRELALQVTRDVTALARGAPFRAAAVYGGVPYDEQLAALRDPGTTCVVATPGRLLDFRSRKQVDLTGVGFVVLDEADRMLDFGFLPDVERVLQDVPGARQTALFSATMPKEVAKLARKYLSNPREVAPSGPQRVPERGVHFRVDVPSSQRTSALLAVLARERPRSAIVFTRTRDGARRLARRLADEGFVALALHGDLPQAERERVLAGFGSREVVVLVATDVAARGLHIPDVTHVVNYDVPEEAEAYVHRAGRTARAGKGGRVFTIVTEKDRELMDAALSAARVRPRAYDPGPLSIETTEGGEAPVSPRMPLPKRAVTPRRVAEDGGPLVEGRSPEFSLPPSRRARRRRGE